MTQADDINVYYVAAPRRKVLLIDALIEKAKALKINDYIQTENDWEIVHDLFRFWLTEYPEDYEGFKRSVENIRSNLKRDDGIVKDKDAMMQHQLEIPEKFYLMLVGMFPDQDKHLDEKFVRELARRIPILQIGQLGTRK